MDILNSSSLSTNYIVYFVSLYFCLLCISSVYSFLFPHPLFSVKKKDYVIVKHG